MRCASRGFIVAFVGLMLMTAGFCLAMAGWFTPPVMVNVLPIRLAGTISFFSGLLVLLGSCCACAVQQGRCCRRCYTDTDNISIAVVRERDRKRKTTSGRRKQRPKAETEVERSSLQDFTPKASRAERIIQPERGNRTETAALLPLESDPRCDQLERSLKVSNYRNQRSETLPNQGKAGTIHAEKLPKRGKRSPSTEDHSLRNKKNQEGDHTTSLPVEYLYVSPRFTEAERFEDFRFTKRPNTDGVHAGKSVFRRSSSSGNLSLENFAEPLFGPTRTLHATSTVSLKDANELEMKEEARETSVPPKAGTGEINKTRWGQVQGQSKEFILSREGMSPAQPQTRHPFQQPAKRCRSCEEKYLLRISGVPERKQQVPGLPPANGSAIRGISGVGIAVEQTRRVLPHMSRHLSGYRLPIRADIPRVSSDSRGRTWKRSAAKEKVERWKEKNAASIGLGTYAEGTSGCQVSPVKYRRVLCPVHDLQSKAGDYFE